MCEGLASLRKGIEPYLCGVPTVPDQPKRAIQDKLETAFTKAKNFHLVDTYFDFFWCTPVH